MEMGSTTQPPKPTPTPLPMPPPGGKAVLAARIRTESQGSAKSDGSATGAAKRAAKGAKKDANPLPGYTIPKKRVLTSPGVDNGKGKALDSKKTP